MKTNAKNFSMYFGVLLTIAIVVGVRELALVICTAFGMPSATNIVGLLSFFIILVIVRLVRGNLPSWLSSSAGTLLIDSGFAFLPVSAGVGVLLFGLGADLVAVVAVIIMSTVIPLWVFAWLFVKWFADDGNKTDKIGGV